MNRADRRWYERHKNDYVLSCKFCGLVFRDEMTLGEIQSHMEGMHDKTGVNLRLDELVNKRRN